LPLHLQGGDFMFGFSTYETIDLLISFSMLVLMLISIIIAFIDFFRHKK